MNQKRAPFPQDMANYHDILILSEDTVLPSTFINIKIYVVLNVDDRSEMGISWSNVQPIQLYVVVPGRMVYWLSTLALASDTNFIQAMPRTKFLKSELF